MLISPLAPLWQAGNGTRLTPRKRYVGGGRRWRGAASQRTFKILR
jgi:hypothetical protein